jgi:hypothetical protein
MNTQLTDERKAFEEWKSNFMEDAGYPPTEMDIWEARRAQPEPATHRSMIEDFIAALANEAIKTPDASIAELLGALGYVRTAAPTVVGPDMPPCETMDLLVGEHGVTE